MEPDSPTDEEKQSKPDEGISDLTIKLLNLIIKQFLHILSLFPTRYQHNMKTLSEVSSLFHSSVVSLTLR